jgi:hypothetical protein
LSSHYITQNPIIGVPRHQKPPIKASVTIYSIMSHTSH